MLIFKGLKIQPKKITLLLKCVTKEYNLIDLNSILYENTL